MLKRAWIALLRIFAIPADAAVQYCRDQSSITIVTSAARHIVQFFVCNFTFVRMHLCKVCPCAFLPQLHLSLIHI